MRTPLFYIRSFFAVFFLTTLCSGCIDTSGYNKIYCSQGVVTLSLSIKDTIGGLDEPVVIDRFVISSRQREKWEIDTTGFYHLYYSYGIYPYCSDLMLPLFYEQTGNPSPTDPATGNVSVDTLDLKGWRGQELMLDTFVVVSGNICHVYKVKGPDVIYKKH